MCRHADFITFIKELPLVSPPEVFGLHENADITRQIQESNAILESFLHTQVREHLVREELHLSGSHPTLRAQ